MFLSLSLESKKAIFNEVSGALSSAQTVVIAKYHGVTVADMTAVRVSAREAKVYFHVVKNTIVRKAVEGGKFAPLASSMSGPLIYSISEDPIAAAKVINDFANKSAALKIVGGMYNERSLDVAGVKQLANIPSRPVLLSQLLGTMKQIPASFVRCVARVAENKSAAA